MSAPAKPSTRRLRWAYLALAYMCVGLAAVGVVLPGLPTTPFLLVAAWAASRGSERLHRRLYEHPRYGVLLRDWHEQGAVPRRARRLGVLLMLLSWLIILWRSEGLWLPLLTGACLIGTGTFLLTRPDPRNKREDSER